MQGDAWYRLTVEEVRERLAVRKEDGLSEGEARRRQERYGPNEIQGRKPVSPVLLFLRQFQDFMVLVLLGATGVSFYLGETADGVTIVAIVVVNAILGYIQESRAERSLESLRQMTAPHTTVLREGEVRKVEAREVVPGDLVLVEAGDRVVADLRLVNSNRLEAEEATLTGESAPVAKQADWRGEGEEDIPLAERHNLLYQGSIITRGHGQGLVVATGMETEMGQIAHLLKEQVEGPTPLQKRLDGLGKMLVVACLGICAVVVGVGVIRGEGLYPMILSGVSLAVAAIPEGLPAIVTVALAVGVQRMIRRQAVIRRLPAVETLGCCTTICTDKTGTVTRNQMTVRTLSLAGGRVAISGEGYEPTGEWGTEGGGHRLAEDARFLMAAAALCTNATLFRHKKGGKDGKGGRFDIAGDPTEGAILVAAAKGGLWRSELDSRYRRLEEIPFDSTTRQMEVRVGGAGGSRRILKGAIDVVLPQASFLREQGVVRRIENRDRTRLEEEGQALAAQALRVLAVAETWEGDPDGALIFLGLIGMADPPRMEVEAAVRRCQEAGIRTVMITGDQPATARAIAREVGILRQDDPPEAVASGADLDGWDDEVLRERILDLKVLARVSPRHKLRVVRALRDQGQVVAMTGDGVNDAPALKEADIGVAMGQGGTEVAKEASAMVLTDDNFATIVQAVAEGRAIYDNIRKFIRYLLSCNVGEVMVMFLAAVMGAPLPLLPIQILWVNLVTDGLPAMALGVDPSDEDVMARPPRSPQEHVFSRGLGFKILTRGTWIGVSTLLVFFGALTLGKGLVLARTLAFATLVGSQLFHVFECRSEQRSFFEIPLFSNPALVLAVASSLGLLLLAIYLPAMQPLFQTAPLSLRDWGVVTGVSAAGSLAFEIRRRLFVRRPRKALQEG